MQRSTCSYQSVAKGTCCFAGPDFTVSQSAPKSPSPLPSQAPADVQTRNSSGAESSAPIPAAELQDHQRVAKSEAERALSASKGIDVGSDAVKGPEHFRSTLYESELPRPRSSGGPPLHKEMADAMIAQAGDWSGIHAYLVHFVLCVAQVSCVKEWVCLQPFQAVCDLQKVAYQQRTSGLWLLRFLWGRNIESYCVCHSCPRCCSRISERLVSSCLGANPYCSS